MTLKKTQTLFRIVAGPSKEPWRWRGDRSTAGPERPWATSHPGKGGGGHGRARAAAIQVASTPVRRD